MTELSKKGKNATSTSLDNGTNNIPSVKDFKARRLSKSEMARLYKITLDALRKRLMKKAGLMDELITTGYDKNQNEYTKEQVKIIIKHLGEPFKN